MGCSSSRPVDGNSASNDCAVRLVSQVAVPETATNPSGAYSPPPLDPSSTRHHGQCGQQQPQQRQQQQQQPLRQVALTEHYNQPLVRPTAWKSTSRTWTRSQLARERNDFFETRITGRREVWDALRQVTECVREGDLVTAQGILDAAEVTLPTGKLENGAYDEAGNLYRLSRVILRDPTNVVDEEDEKAEEDEGEGEGDAQTVVGVASSCAKDDKVVEVDENGQGDDGGAKPEGRDKGKGKADGVKDAVAVRCRLSDRGGPDIVVLLGRKEPVRLLARRAKEEGSVPASARVRIAYLGRILDEKQPLPDQGWKEGHVVNALVSGAYRQE